MAISAVIIVAFVATALWSKPGLLIGAPSKHNEPNTPPQPMRFSWRGSNSFWIKEHAVHSRASAGCRVVTPSGLHAVNSYT